MIKQMSERISCAIAGSVVMGVVAKSEDTGSVRDLVGAEQS